MTTSNGSAVPLAAHEIVGADENVAADYTRVGRRDLQQICKVRGIPADGSNVDLIAKLQAWDARHGADPDVTVPDDDVDLLGDDDETPAGGAAASNPPAGPAAPEGAVRAGQPGTPDVGASAARGESAAAPTVTTTLPGAPAVTVTAAPAGAEAAHVKRGRPDLSVTDGVASQGEGTLGPKNAYRAAYTIGDRDVTDDDHFRYIADTHARAAAAGMQTKGGATIGERVGYGTDGNGQRTAIYQVPLRRGQ
jgi:hypothetical protein